MASTFPHKRGSWLWYVFILFTDFLSDCHCYPRLSPGAHPLTKKPEDSGYEIQLITEMCESWASVMLSASEQSMSSSWTRLFCSAGRLKLFRQTLVTNYSVNVRSYLVFVQEVNTLRVMFQNALHTSLGASHGSHVESCSVVMIADNANQRNKTRVHVQSLLWLGYLASWIDLINAYLISKRFTCEIGSLY